MAISRAKEKIHAALQDWPGITSRPHRFGGTEYCLGRREIGHIHGDSLVDIPFPMEVRNDLVTAGRAEPHHVLPESGWVSVYLKQATDVDRAIELLRLSFEIAEQESGTRGIFLLLRDQSKRFAGFRNSLLASPVSNWS